MIRAVLASLVVAVAGYPAARDLHLIARKHHSIRAHYRHFHMRHGRTCERVGKVGIFGEMGYHAAEVAGLHGGVLLAASVLLVVALARVLAGEL